MFSTLKREGIFALLVTSCLTSRLCYRVIKTFICLKVNVGRMLTPSPVILMRFPFRGNTKWAGLKRAKGAAQEGGALTRKPVILVL